MGKIDNLFKMFEDEGKSLTDVVDEMKSLDKKAMELQKQISQLTKQGKQEFGDANNILLL